jgi:hypothetical protein
MSAHTYCESFTQRDADPSGSMSGRLDEAFRFCLCGVSTIEVTLRLVYTLLVFQLEYMSAA